jgi:hypothetical protein
MSAGARGGCFWGRRRNDTRRGGRRRGGAATRRRNVSAHGGPHHAPSPFFNRVASIARAVGDMAASGRRERVGGARRAGQGRSGARRPRVGACQASPTPSRQRILTMTGMQNSGEAQATVLYRRGTRCSLLTASCFGIFRQNRRCRQKRQLPKTFLRRTRCSPRRRSFAWMSPLDSGSRHHCSATAGGAARRSCGLSLRGSALDYTLPQRRCSPWWVGRNMCAPPEIAV